MVVKEWWWTFGKEKLGCQILQGGNGNLDAPAFGNGKLGFHTSSSRKLTSCFNIVAEQIRNTQKNISRQKEFRTGYTGVGVAAPPRDRAHKIRHAVLQPGARSRGPGRLYRGRCAGGGQRSIYTVSGQTLDLMDNIANGQVDKQKIYFFKNMIFSLPDRSLLKLLATSY